MGKEEQIRNHTVNFFQEMVVLLQKFGNTFQQFAKCSDHTFQLTRMAKFFRDLLNYGFITDNIDLQEEKEKNSIRLFVQRYLYTIRCHDEIKTLVEKRDRNYKIYPFIFYQLVAQMQFNENYDQADEAFAKPDANSKIHFSRRSNRGKSESSKAPKKT